MFRDYPDVVTVKQVQKMLGVGRNTAYKLLTTSRIKSIKEGGRRIIPKRCVIEYVKGNIS